MGSVETGSDGNLKKQLEKANKFKVDFAVILKDADNCAIKNMSDGSQREMPIAYLYDEFGRIMEERFYG